MNIYSLICTRDLNKIPSSLMKTLEFYKNCDIKTKLLVNQTSIFEGYSAGFEEINPQDDDIIIFCHDDIEFNGKTEDFLSILEERLVKNPKSGFIGPAGTSFLSQNAVWWDQTVWRAGKHRGLVSHISPEGKKYDTDYGPEGQVVVLDGLFLAAKASTIRKVGLNKPKYFEGEWDFYDIHYTSEAHKAGFENFAFRFPITHHSRGELVGRESWHKNREAFVNNNNLPLQLND